MKSSINNLSKKIERTFMLDRMKVKAICECMDTIVRNVKQMGKARNMIKRLTKVTKLRVRKLVV